MVDKDNYDQSLAPFVELNNELEAKLFGGGNTGDAAPETTETVASEQGSETATETTDSAETVGTPVQETREEKPANPDDDPNSPTWKHRYEVLKGKEYAEVPRLSAENKELRSELEQFKAELEALKASGKTQETPKAEEPEIDPQDVRDLADKYEVSPEFAEELLRKQAKAVKREMAKLKGEIEPVRQSVEQMRQQEAQREAQAYDNALFEAVPNINEVYESEAFRNWAGDGLLNVLKVHHQNRDAARVIEIFKTFEQLRQPPQTAQPQAQTQVNPQADLKRRQIAAQAVPQARSSAPQPQTQAPTLTAEQWKTQYSTIGRGLRTREADEALKAELNKMLYEGRVLG